MLAGPRWSDGGVVGWWVVGGSGARAGGVVRCLDRSNHLVVRCDEVTHRNRVSLAIELIEEGSIACSQLLPTLFFPPLPFLLQVLLQP